MATWNYRVIAVEQAADDEPPVLMFAEVHYNEAGDPTGWSKAFMHGESMDELGMLLGRLGRAMGEPVLEERDIKAEPARDVDEWDDVG